MLKALPCTVLILCMAYQAGICRAAQCGNNVTEPGEACDGEDVNGFTCGTVAGGLVSGVLTCQADCRSYDVSSCMRGAVVHAASCSNTDVQTAINNAADGATVLIPAGTCAWAAPIHLGSRSIALSGSGELATHITLTPRGGYQCAGICVDAVKGKPFRITNLWMDGPQGSDYAVVIHGEVDNVRIDHCRFTGQAHNSIKPEGSIYGVVDHCQFLDASQEVISIRDWPKDVSGWTVPTRELLGAAAALFVEDCSFESTGGMHSHTLTGACGSRYVYRHNLARRPTYSDVDLHGFCFDTCTSGRLFEVYENTFVGLNNGYNWTLNLRGGEGVVFNNTFTNEGGSFPGLIHLQDYRAHSDCPAVTPQSCSLVDPDTPSTWEMPDRPCFYQVHNTFIWGNVHNGVASFPAVKPEDARHIVEDRDFFLRAPSRGLDGFDYVPYVYPHPLTAMAETTRLDRTGPVDGDEDTPRCNCSTASTGEQASRGSLCVVLACWWLMVRPRRWQVQTAVMHARHKNPDRCGSAL